MDQHPRQEEKVPDKRQKKGKEPAVKKAKARRQEEKVPDEREKREEEPAVKKAKTPPRLPRRHEIKSDGVEGEENVLDRRVLNSGNLPSRKYRRVNPNFCKQHRGPVSANILGFACDRASQKTKNNIAAAHLLIGQPCPYLTLTLCSPSN